MAIPPEHATVLEQIRQSVAADDRFMALGAGGSLLYGGMDEHSDLDLVVVVDDSHHTAVMGHRREIAAGWMPLLAAFTGEHVGEPRLLICLCAEPLLHVDLKFVTSAELRQRIEDPAIVWERDAAISAVVAASDPAPVVADAQWIEDRFWIWIHYAATKLGRGELFEVLEFLGFLRAQVFAPLACQLRNLPIRGVRRLEQHLPDVVPELAATVARHDREECAAAITQCVDLYRTMRDQLPSAVRRDTRAEESAVLYLHHVIGAATRAEHDEWQAGAS